MTFTHRFTHYFVEFCRDRRLRTFVKVVQKNLQHRCSKRGGGQRPFEQCKKTLHYWWERASLTDYIRELGIIDRGPIISPFPRFRLLWDGKHRYHRDCWKNFPPKINPAFQRNKDFDDNNTHDEDTQALQKLPKKKNISKMSSRICITPCWIIID